MSRQTDVETLPDRIASRLALRSPRRVDGTLRGAAVLVPLVEREGGYSLVLTRRAADLRRQPGDIAFPGGMVDPGDPSEVAAALREGREEIGLDPGGVLVLGQLDDRVTVQRFRLVPFVALIPSSAVLRAGPEVDEIFEVPLRTLLHPDCETTEVQRSRKLPGGTDVVSRVVFRYRYRDRDFDIWGLTARIIRDLLDVI
ncbi:MAG: CoA pyrophosphatase [Acidobacteria bacterium]|nr:CoA pyrophosphatase [Acidobacteriota bacterium]